MMRLPELCCLTIAVAALCGCATPESRIKKNFALFSTFPLDVQENVRRGRIALGYTKDMARMALGPPRRVNTRVDKNGKVEVWSYVQTYYTYDYYWPESPPVFRDAKGKVYYPVAQSPNYRRVEREKEYEAFRVEFSGGKVTSIEETKR